MNSEQLIELTKQFIHGATHYDMNYIRKIYSDKLLIVRVDEQGNVSTTTKEELVAFFQLRHDESASPLSEQAHFHHAAADDDLAIVTLDRTMDLYGRMEKMFFTLIWQKSANGWQVVKESVTVTEVIN